jgi:general secretion pathway protein E
MSQSPGALPFAGMNFDGVPLEKTIADLLKFVVEVPVSDLFIDCDEYDTAISVRHLGIFKHLTTVSLENGRRLINRIKAGADMDLAQRFHPLDGRWVAKLNDGSKVDLRVNTIPTLFGEDMAIRLLRHDQQQLDLSKLGFHHKNLDDLLSLLARPSGLILVTGPAGAGKTTSLYAALTHLNNGMRKINTIEDPVEYVIPGIRQSQINPKQGLGFPELLSSVLRQAPDVIMVGEIRDSVTAETAVRAANTGHLVFATLHAPVAAGAIDAMLALGTVPHFLATSLIGIVSQRLVRKLCGRCKVSFDLSGAPETFDDIREMLKPGQGELIHSAPGCEHCFQEGYNGRTGVAEVLRVTREIRRLIFERSSAQEIRDEALRQGMLDLRRSALLKVAQGITSTEELIRVIPTEHLLPDE